MFRLLNQYSFVATAVVVLGVVLLAVRRRSGRTRWTVLAAAIVLLGMFALALRTGPGDVPRSADFDRALTSGKPVALEFYSNY